jgi:hypothetical protein
MGSPWLFLADLLDPAQALRPLSVLHYEPIDAGSCDVSVEDDAPHPGSQFGIFDGRQARALFVGHRLDRSRMTMMLWLSLVWTGSTERISTCSPAEVTANTDELGSVVSVMSSRVVRSV